MDDQKINQIIKDTALAVQQATKSENSGLIGDLRRNVAVLQENHKEVVIWLQRIEAQTVKTNGSVRSLQAWRGYIMGGLAVITVVILPLIFLVIKNVISIQTNTQNINNLQANAGYSKQN